MTIDLRKIVATFKVEIKQEFVQSNHCVYSIVKIYSKYS